MILTLALSALPSNGESHARNRAANLPAIVAGYSGPIDGSAVRADVAVPGRPTAEAHPLPTTRETAASESARVMASRDDPPSRAHLDPP
jgi:hypothetical protein